MNFDFVCIKLTVEIYGERREGLVGPMNESDEVTPMLFVHHLGRTTVV